MSVKLYVGNLPYKTSESELKAHFAQMGQVNQVQLIIDKMTSRPRGFGFVIMEDKDAAQEAIKKFHGAEFNGRPLTVNEARPLERRNNRPPRPQAPVAQAA